MTGPTVVRTKTFIVRAPIGRVYEYLCDPRHSMRPRPEAMVDVEQIHPPGAPESTYRLSVLTTAGYSGTYEMTYQELIAPRHIAATVVGRATGGPDMGATRVTYDLASVPDGTVVTERSASRPGIVKAGLLWFGRLSGIWRAQSRSAGTAMALAIERWATAHPASDIP